MPATIFRINHSNILTVCIKYGANIGTLGPRFSIITNNAIGHASETDFPLWDLALFLNDATGRNGKSRFITKDVEDEIVAHFSTHFLLEENKYVFTSTKKYDSSGWLQDYSKLYEINTLIDSINSTGQEEKQDYATVHGIKTLLDSANAIGQEEKEGDFTSDKAFEVYLNCYGITNSTSTKPILGTYGAGPCIIVACYNSSAHEAFLAHVTSGTSIASLITNVRKISHIDDELEAHLRGGTDESTDLAAQIIYEIKKSQI